MFRYRFLFIFLVVLLALLSACSSNTDQLQSTATTPIEPLATSTIFKSPTSTKTEVPATATPTKVPTETATPLPTATATETPTNTPTLTSTPRPVSSAGFGGDSDSVLIYFIHRGTGGSICGSDSVIAIRSGVKQTGDVAKDIKAGLKKLLSYKGEMLGAYYNPLYRSNMHVKKVTFKQGMLKVYLTGTYVRSGDDCDNTRVRAQVWSTVKQYKDVKSTIIYLNDLLLGDRLANDK